MPPDATGTPCPSPIPPIKSRVPRALSPWWVGSGEGKALPAVRRAGAALLIAATAILAVLALDRIFPPDLSRLHAAGVEVLDRDGRTLSVLPAPGGVWRLRTAVADVPPRADRAAGRGGGSALPQPPRASIRSRSARAAVQWVRAGRVVSGGSTLTMQAARLLEPRPRTLRSKVIEIFRALQLEARFGKDEILGIWLTLAPQGGNIEGMRAGCARLVRPARGAARCGGSRRCWSRWRAGRRRCGRTAIRMPRARRAMRCWRGAAGRRRACRRPIARCPSPPPCRTAAAPCRAWRRIWRGRWRAVRPALSTLTLDASLQRATERLAAEILPTLPDRAALAIVVADVATREVRALIGGEWGAESRAGALDLTRAVRSPGSALKPFLYAMAFERGIATPGTIVADLPRHFGDYAPENFVARLRRARHGGARRCACR